VYREIKRSTTRDLASHTLHSPLLFAVKMLSLVPFSVRQRSRGLVMDPAIRGISMYQSKWVPAGTTVADRKLAYNAKVDRTVDALAKFVAIWVQQSRRARREYAVRKAGEDWRNLVWATSWANLMYEEDLRRQAIIDAYHARLVAMPEAELREYNARTIREIREHNDDPWPWMNLMRTIRAKRALVQITVAEHKQVWQEMSLKNIGVPVRLHNTQAVTKKRVIRKNTFSALEDSDSDNDLTKEEMDNLERILQG